MQYSLKSEVSTFSLSVINVKAGDVKACDVLKTTYITLEISTLPSSLKKYLLRKKRENVVFKNSLINFKIT